MEKTKKIHNNQQTSPIIIKTTTIIVLQIKQNKMTLLSNLKNYKCLKKKKLN